MRGLIEFKTSVVSLVEKYEYYALCIGRFIVMLFAFLLVQQNICYFDKLDNIFIPMILAIFCSVVPMSLGAVILQGYILVNLIGLGKEVVVVVGAIFLLIFLLYFRFAKGNIYRAILTPILTFFHIPYILPVTCGLKGTPSSVVSVLCGTVVYYLLMGIKASESVFLGTAEITAIDKILLTLNQVVKNEEMWIIIAAFSFTTMLVYVIRRLSVKHAWRTASLVGIAANLILILVGKLLLDNAGGIVWLLIGSIISVVVVLAYEFVFMNLDYSRAEHVQFEDDNYYYYVKAIPKLSLQSQKKSIKRFNRKPEAEEVDPADEEKERLAKEFEIDRSLLK